MATIYDVNPNKLINEVAKKLEEVPEVKPPVWSHFVKTGMHKERPPSRKDWWQVRCAAILRAVYKLGPIGVSKLRVKYGGRKNRGHKPDKFAKASGNIIRKSLQQLEKAGLIKQVEIKKRKGRVITPKGKSLLDKTAVDILKESKQK